MVVLVYAINLGVTHLWHLFLLKRPFGSRMSGDVKVKDSPRVDFHKKGRESW